MRQVRLDKDLWGDSLIEYVIEDDLEHEGIFCNRGSITVSDEVEGHYVIHYHGKHKLDPDRRYDVEILGVEHDSDRVQDRWRECAVKYARDLAESRGAEFVNNVED